MPLLLDRLLAVALADGGGGGSLPPHLALDTPRRACVAIVLRVPAAAGATAAPQFEDLAALRRWLEAQPAPDRPDAEVLFIRRAVNPRDRWSGQVAFPGGRNAPGEDDRSCVEREFREELGVDLARPRFRCLGRLADRLVRTRTPFCVATFVYIDMAVGGAPLEFRLAPAEVAEAFWRPASLVTGPQSRIQCLQLRLDSLILPSASPPVRLARLVGVTALSFPCIYLGPHQTDNDYALWGLSLGIISDLLKTAGLPSIGERRRRELWDAHPGLSRHATLPFLTDSRVMNALLSAYFDPYGRRLVRWAAIGGAVGAALVSVGWLASQQRRARL